MALRKIHSTIVLIVLTTSVFAQSGQWQTITSLREVRSFGTYNGNVFVATSGGMLEITDPASPGVVYDNISGFGTIDLRDFLVAESGELWTFGIGRITRGINESVKPYLITDIDDELIGLTCASDDGQNLWVGTDQGLILFSKVVDGGQILDSYTLFGDLNPEPTINEVITPGTSIWLATSEGLAMADRSNPVLLKAPANWTSFDVTTHPELGSESITSVAFYANDIYVATDAGLFRFTIDQGTGDTGFVALPIGTNISSANLRVQSDTLFCYYDDATGGGIAAYDGNQITQLPRTGLVGAPITGLSHNGVRWVSTDAGGIYHNASGTYVQYPFAGPMGNRVTGIVVDESGTIWGGFFNDSAAYFDGESWFNLPFFVRAGVNDVASDGRGGTYFGTEGNGWWRYVNGTLKKFDHLNSTLRGPNSDPIGAAFVIVRDAVFSDGWVFALNREPWTNHPIAFVRYDEMDNPAAWDSLGPAEGFTNKFISSIDYANGQLAVATDVAGIFFCDVGDNPDFKVGYDCIHYEEGFPSNLLSNTVRVVKFSPSGDLWAGTNFGLNRYEFFEEGFVPVTLPDGIGPDVSDIEFDGRGNVWVSCSNGLARIDATTGQATGYTSLNSYLVNDDINDIFYDRYSGRVYVATEQGISVIPSEIGTPTARIDSVVAFPNPFIISNGSERIQFNYLENGTISIHSVAGELIDEFSVNDGWDGRNGGGAEAASGVYLWVLRNDDSEIARGKILLIRK